MSEGDNDAQDQADMEALAAGHGVALDRLMERHGEHLFHYLIRALQNESDAADLAQETFVRVYQHRAKFNSQQKFTTWLYTIATNLVRDRFRWRSRHPDVSLQAELNGGQTIADLFPEPAPGPSVSLEVEERGRAVRNAVGALPEKLRTPLILSEYGNLSSAEIAAILKCTPKAVETRIYRARTRLRKVLTAQVDN